MVWVLLVLCAAGFAWLSSLEKRVSALAEAERQRRIIEARQNARASAEEMLRTPFDPAKTFTQAFRLQEAASDGLITFDEFCQKLDSMCEQQEAFEKAGGVVSFSWKQTREAAIKAMRDAAQATKGPGK